MTVDIEMCKDGEYWDELVGRSPHGSIFHTWSWLKIVEKHTSSKLYPIVGFKGSTPIGLYPIFLKKRSFIKMVFSPPPYTAVPYLGPALVDYDKLKEDKKLANLRDYHRTVDDFIFSELKAGFALINLHRSLLDCRPFKWTGYRLYPIFHYTLDLSRGLDEVWAGFKKEFRENVKKTKKKGITFEEGSYDDLKYIYRSIIRIYEQQDKKVYISENYLKDLYKTFSSESLKIFVARYRREPIQGIVTLCYDRTVQFWIGGAKTNIKGVYPNEFLHWEVMRWAHDNGFKLFEEFGAGTERLAIFKSKYNPNLNVCFQAKKSGLIFRLYERAYAMFRNWVKI